MKLNRKQAFFCVVLFLLVIGLLEVIFRLLAIMSPRADQLLGAPTPAAVSDGRLGHRPNPAYPGHDRKGFRNPEVPAKAHIVSLGDSQTYGEGVKPEEAWPRQLESMTRKTVYSMAYGGYGPTHSLVLWDEAVALSPKIVIEAFYAGNDLFDSFDLVYNKGQFPTLKSSDPQLQATLREAEQFEPISKRVSRMFGMETMPVPRSLQRLQRLLSKYSKVYSLLERAWYESGRLTNETRSPEEKWKMAEAFAVAHPAYCQVFNNGQFKTVFTSEYRLSALNLGDPRIAEGLHISLRALQRMHELAVVKNIRFLVVLIPTKEAVFRRLWQNPSESYRSLAENEERVWRITKDFLKSNGVEYLDTLSVLQEQLATGIQPYQVSHDGHPNAQGHEVIAKLVAARLELPKTLHGQTRRRSSGAR